MKNIMVYGDLPAHINRDTLDKTNLYGLGPVDGLKGEITVLNGKYMQHQKAGIPLLNGKDKTSLGSTGLFTGELN